MAGAATATVGILTKLTGFSDVQKAFGELARGNTNLSQVFRNSSLATSTFGQGIARLQGQVSGLLGVIGRLSPIVGALSIGGFAAAIKSASDWGDQLAITARKVGVTTTQLQEYQHAARLAGVEQGELSLGLRFLTRNVGEAAQGSRAATDNFRRLGVNIRDASGEIKSTDQIFEEVADSISRMGSESRRNAALMELFGRSGVALAPLFEQGAEGIRAAREEAQRLGLVIGDDLIAGAQAANDTFDRFFATLDVAYRRIFISLTPAVAALDDALQRLAPRVQEAAGSFGEWMAEQVTAFADWAESTKLTMGDVGRYFAEFGIIWVSKAFGPWGIAVGLVTAALIELGAEWKRFFAEAGPQAETLGGQMELVMGKVAEAHVTLLAEVGRFYLDMQRTVLEGVGDLAGKIGGWAKETFDQVFGQDATVSLDRAMVRLDDSLASIMARTRTLGGTMGSPFREAAGAMTAASTAAEDLAFGFVGADARAESLAASTGAVSAAVSVLGGHTMAQVRASAEQSAVTARVLNNQRAYKLALEEQTEASKRAEQAETELAKREELRRKEVERLAQTMQVSGRIVLAAHAEEARAIHIKVAAERLFGETVVKSERDAVHAYTMAREALEDHEEAQQRLQRSTDRVFASMKATVQDYFEEIGDRAKNASDAVRGMLDSLTGSIADFFATGKLSFSRFFDAVRHEMAQFFARDLMFSLFGGPQGQSALTGAFGIGLGLGGGGGGAGVGGAGTGGGGFSLGGLFDFLSNPFGLFGGGAGAGGTGGGGGGVISGGVGTDVLSGGGGTDTLTGGGGFLSNILGLKLGQATLGGLLGAGLSGFVGGQFLNTLIGGNTTGGGIGGGIGAIAGSFLPIPGGSFIGGAIGSVIGGLFGGKKKPPSMEASTKLDPFGGTVTGTGAYHGAAASSAKELGNAFLTAFNAVIQALGGSLFKSFKGPAIGAKGGKFFMQPNGELVGDEGRVYFDSAEEAIAAAVRTALQRGRSINAIRGINGKVLATLFKSLDRGIDEAISDALFAKQLLGIGGDPLQQQIALLERTFVDQGVRALQLDLPLQKVVQGYASARKQFENEQLSFMNAQIRAFGPGSPGAAAVETQIRNALQDLDTVSELKTRIQKRWASIEASERDEDATGTMVRPMRHGGTIMAQSPTLILAGEAGAERIDVTPARTSRAVQGGSVQVTFAGPAILDDLSMARFLAKLDQAQRRRERRVYG